MEWNESFPHFTDSFEFAAHDALDLSGLFRFLGFQSTAHETKLRATFAEVVLFSVIWVLARSEEGARHFPPDVWVEQQESIQQLAKESRLSIKGVAVKPTCAESITTTAQSIFSNLLEHSSDHVGAMQQDKSFVAHQLLQSVLLHAWAIGLLGHLPPSKLERQPWMIRTGLRFGSLNALYAADPEICHSSFLVVDNIEEMTWRKLLARQRLASSVRKKLLIFEPEIDLICSISSWSCDEILGN